MWMAVIGVSSRGILIRVLVFDVGDRYLLMFMVVMGKVFGVFGC